MAHQIHFNDQTGRHSFFSVKEKPWHKLGQIVENYPTSAEAIRHAGLDFEVAKGRLFTPSSPIVTEDVILSGKLEIPNYCSTVRTDTDTVLGVVGKDYHIVQNRDAFSFFDSIVGGTASCTKLQERSATANAFSLPQNFPII